MNEIRKAIVSALDAVIITTMLAAGLAAGFLYVFRWPLVVIWAVAMLAKVL